MSHANSTWSQVVKDLENWSNTVSVPEVSNNSISMIVGGNEMIKIDKDGFYVRGEKVLADEKEAESVYKAFKQFLVWSELSKS